MTEQAVNAQIVHKWYSRPVVFVTDVNRAIRFYVEMLGFEKSWHKDTVCQVNRSECEIILCQDATRRDKARLFIELTPEGLAELRREIVDRSVPSKATWWGYDSIQIDDPDGNELLFPYQR
jgi:catechol 2,3-dioxygenase-like lactoylglutathione lyase family enzyme